MLSLLLLIPSCYLPRKQENDVAVQMALEQKLSPLLREAVTKMRRGELARAQAALELAAELSPNDPRVLDGLGCVLFRQGNLPLAQRFFQEALLRDRNYHPAYTHLALLAEKQGDRLAAKELLLYGLQANGKNYRARNNYGAMLLDEQDKKAAYFELWKAYYASPEGSKQHREEGTLELRDPVLGHNLEQLGH